MKKILFIIAVLVTAMMQAQSLEGRYRRFQQQSAKIYKDFRDEANIQYEGFLRGSWESFRLNSAVARPVEKPMEPVSYTDVQSQVEDKHVQVEVLSIPESAISPAPISPILEKASSQQASSITYCGTEFQIRFPSQRIHLSDIDGDTLARQWERVCEDEYDNLIFDCLANREAHHLCDWAYIELCGEVARSIYGTSNEATFLQAFLLAQSGYAMRLAKSEKGMLCVLVGSLCQIYEKGCVEMDGLFFYPLQPVEDRIQICTGSFDGEQPFRLTIDVDQDLAMQQEDSPMHLSSLGLAANSMVNVNLIEFYNAYPTGQVGGDCRTRWAAYANAPMDACVRQSLYPTLMQAIMDEPEEQAVSKLLNWVQTAFDYEADENIWGQDRPFFPLETLHYPYADCEDRAILFSRVVRDLMKLNVVFLYYPDHLATAVALNKEIEGDYVLFDGVRYTVCDPSYIGAPIGVILPGLEDQKATIIPLQK